MLDWSDPKICWVILLSYELATNPLLCLPTHDTSVFQNKQFWLCPCNVKRTAFGSFPTFTLLQSEIQKHEVEDDFLRWVCVIEPKSIDESHSADTWETNHAIIIFNYMLTMCLSILLRQERVQKFVETSKERELSWRHRHYVPVITGSYADQWPCLLTQPPNAIQQFVSWLTAIESFFAA